MAHARSLRIALPAAALLFLMPDDADAQYRYLCTSVPSACTYTGPDAPMLEANVCYGSAIGIRLMSGGSCPTGSWPYYVEAGELVDPTTNEVAAYIPLDDACSRPGLCVEGPPPPGAQEDAICCNADYVCTPAAGACGAGEIGYFCHDGVSNDDGTVTCFDATPGSDY